jgi:hypothetical protein
MSTWPNTDVLWCEHWHDRADRRAWRPDAPRQTPDAAARPAITNSNPSAEWAERRTHTASRCTCVCVHYAPVPHRCEQHSTACACALCAADGSSGSRAMCSTLRPAFAIVPEDAGARYSASSTCAVASLPAGSASADGKHRRHKQRGEGWGARQGGLRGVVRRRAECTSLSPAPYAASFPNSLAHCLGVLLRARGCCGFRFRLCGAAQRYPSMAWTAPSAPRSSSSATHAEWPLCAAQCSGVCLHSRRRRGLGRRTHRPIRRKRKRRTRRRSGRSRRRWHRRAIGRFGDCRRPPHSAARSCHRCARRGRGAGVGPTGVPQYPTGTRNTKQQARPEGRLSDRFG